MNNPLDRLQDPGLLKTDPQPARDLIDIFCMGICLFDATLVFTVGIGCLVVSIMKGPARYADSARATQPTDDRDGQDRS